MPKLISLPDNALQHIPQAVRLKSVVLQSRAPGAYILVEGDK